MYLISKKVFFFRLIFFYLVSRCGQVEGRSLTAWLERIVKTQTRYPVDTAGQWTWTHALPCTLALFLTFDESN